MDSRIEGVATSEMGKDGNFIVPRPSTDPNDPLVSLPFSMPIKDPSQKAHTGLELATLAEVRNIWHAVRRCFCRCGLCNCALEWISRSSKGLRCNTCGAELLCKFCNACRGTTRSTARQVCSAAAGLMLGQYLIIPISRIVGGSAVIFWSLIATIACGVWSAEMTAADEYISFVVSRLIGGLFSSIPQIIGNGIIVNLFYLHERGRAFAVYTSSFALGMLDREIVPALRQSICRPN